MKQRQALDWRYRFLSVIFFVALIISIPRQGDGFTAHAQTVTLDMRPMIVDSRFRVEPALGKFDVQGFLEDRSSGLAGSLVLAQDGSLVKASTVIDEISLHYGIAPQVILVLMQLRSGIVDARGPSQSQLDSPLGLPGQLASGFYAQVEWVAKKLDMESPRYYQAQGVQDQELLPLANGTLALIPGGRSPTTALLKFFGTGANDSGALAESADNFDLLYREYFGVDPLEFPDKLTASLTDARLPFEGTRRYTGGPHGGNSTSSCAKIAVGDGSGIDFARNTPSDVENWEVLSILPGTLLSRDTNVNYGIGNRIRIQHSDTLVSEYWHLDKFSSAIQSKNIGDPIPQGFPVGNAGDSGGQYAIHLHLDLRTPAGSPVQWDGETIDGYMIGLHKVFANQNQGFNYQGSAVLGETKRHQISAYCGVSGANYALVGTNFNNDDEQNGVDPDTIFADISYADPYAGRLTSTNVAINGNDGFNGSTLKPFWHWVREDPARWSLAASPGYLRIVTGQNDIREASNDAPLLLQPLDLFPDKDFVIRTRVVLSPAANFQQGGLVIYADDDNYVRLTYAYINEPVFEFAKEIGGNFHSLRVPAPPGIDDFHLLLAKSGAVYSAYYSLDGVAWSWVGTYLVAKLSPLEIGVLAFNGVGATTMEIPVDFDYFQVIPGADKTVVYRSQPGYDGWVLESGEDTQVGGTQDDTGTILNLGDDAENRQYRAVLSFATAGIPDKAVITRVLLKVEQQGFEGADPMKTHNGLAVDIKKKKFYTLPALQLDDFKASAGKYKVGVFPDKLFSGWYKAVLYRGAFPYINKKGRTQLRLRFRLDDNNDNLANILSLYSGDALLDDRPKLIIKYYLP